MAAGPYPLQPQILSLSIYIIQHQCKNQHMDRIKRITAILEDFRMAALPSTIQPDRKQ